jgi:maleate isomerase
MAGEREPPDALGWRAKLAALGPSTNTVVQPDYDGMRPVGVTNHYSRILVQNMDVSDDKSFTNLTDAITASVDAALDSVVTCAPDHIVMGMSAIAFYGGRAGAEAFATRITERCGLGVSTGALSTAAAMERLGGIKKIAFFSPYYPVANAEVSRFYGDSGFDVVRQDCLRCPTPRAIAQVPVSRCREMILALDGDDVDAIVQVGTNLSMVKLAAAAELFLGKPVIAINTATYWHALRSLGIMDAVGGYGVLLERF